MLRVVKIMHPYIRRNFIMNPKEIQVLVLIIVKRSNAYWRVVGGAVILLILASSFTQVSAQTPVFNNADFVMHQKDSSFSIRVPDYLVEVHDLNPDAALQFKNIFNETYLMVVAEQKSVAGHLDLQQLEEHFEFNLMAQGGTLVNSALVHINQHDAFQGEAEWTVDGESLAYLVTFIDTPGTFYKIYSWTLASQKEFLEDFRKAANSFIIANRLQSNR